MSLSPEGELPKCVALVNIGAQYTEISVVVDGGLRFVRTVALGGDTLTTSVGQAFIIETREAENLKRQWATIFLDEGREEEEAGPAITPEEYRTPLDVEPEEQPERPTLELAEEEEEAAPAGPVPEAPKEADEEGDEEYTRRQISRALYGTLSDLAQEIRSTVDYFASRKGIDVERIVLVGGSAKVENLAEFMTRETGVEAVVGDPLRHLSIGSPSLESDFLASIAPFMAISAGLAIRDVIT